ncbi:MAG: ATPase, T2SS/T4P/T4SS family [Microcella sp.]|uniref:CpaF family protein n=1 Tax=Microcella sp. TaxID=1913979 RepID=UPI003315ED69
MPSAASHITARVRERVRGDRVDLHRDPAAAERLAREELRSYVERSLGGAALPTVVDEAQTLGAVLASLTGYGALQPYFDDPEVEEIWINAPDAIFIARGGVSERTDLELTGEEVRTLVERMLQSTGRRVDLSCPFVDASLPDGSRLHVVIPDVTRRHWSVNVRKFSQRIRDLSRLVELASLPPTAAEFLRMSVLAGCNILVSGATHSGKTTLMRAMLAGARPSERIVTVEETFELDLSAPDVVAMQCRSANLEGSGEISLRRLIKETLRMRPDRLVVGEVREAESLDLLIALNSGLPGMCSIHANTAQDALVKLATLPLLAGRNIDSSFVVPTVASAIDLVVHCELVRGGRRRVAEIVAPTGEVVEGTIEAESIFALRGDELSATGTLPAREHVFARAGLDPRPLLCPAVSSVADPVTGPRAVPA